MNNANKIGDWHVYPGVWTPEAGKIANEASVLFRIGTLPIHTYSLTMMLGMIACYINNYYFLKKSKIWVRNIININIFNNTYGNFRRSYLKRSWSSHK